jgi:protoporphyrinogen oxidase
MTIILGAGLAGLSVSYHLGHGNCLILEKNLHAYGHLHAEMRDGFTWDQGPHVSFTKNDYVKRLFSESVEGDYDEYEVRTANYYSGNWIDHPAQSSLYQIPEPLRSQCLDSFLESRKNGIENDSARDYAQWLRLAFGQKFAETFPAAYTRKYWTREPCDLTTDWVGGRVFYPNVEDVISGSRGPLGRQTHYITKVRYPRSGGYQSFARKLARGASIAFGANVVSIDLVNKRVRTADGRDYPFKRLVNSLPLPVFISLCRQSSPALLDAALQLSCSQLLLVNVVAPHQTLRNENWMYVYDEDKFSTRINCTEKLTPGNAPLGYSGIQVEVYFSRHRPLAQEPLRIGRAVMNELAEMGILQRDCLEAGSAKFSLRQAAWANVIFDHTTRPALEKIWSWLADFGLAREADDLDPLTDWSRKNAESCGSLIMAGRFGQWKYFWTDDCVLRGEYLGRVIGGTSK